MADVDHFKPVNDTFGHRAGDAAIKQISRHLSACIRQIDIAARYGGDEFAFVLPNTALEDAVTVAERMVKAVAETPIIFEDKELRLTLSVGVGQYGGDNCSIADVTKTTDLALYAAKLAGRNTVRIVSKQDIHEPSHT
jgi:diguanylate cyclase (GGDEF)-like protein